LIFQVLDEGYCAGFGGGFGFRFAVLGEGSREVMETLPLPFLTDTQRESADRIKS
jgi:hypothetical protein